MTTNESVAGLSDDRVETFLTLNVTSPALKTVLTRAKAERGKTADAEREIAAAQESLKEIAEEQARLRANIDKAPKESETFKRYLKKFDDQETAIERDQARIKALKKDVEKQKQALADYLKGVAAE